VSDNGIGIPPGVIDRIFEPYFTTKDETKSMGIGLYMSKVIIEEHLHGTLTAKSNEAGGATFVMVLPQYREDASYHAHGTMV
jgi:signal transduction histidine kinase